MKRIAYLLLFLTTLSFSSNAQSKAEKKVADAVESLKAALISGNRADLESITSAKLSYGHSGGKVEDKTAFVEALASGKSDFVTIELNDQTVSVSGKVAIVRHKLSAKINDNNVPGTVNLVVMLVFQKEGGQWKLLARQAVKPPVAQ
jgi:ketosteroid isomerase-like protein